MSDSYTVERSTRIEAPPSSVYGRIADFHLWRDWSPWDDLDPDLTRTYSGAASGPGAVYTWAGNRQVGEGRMEITHAMEPTSVQIALDFLKPFKSSSVTTFDLEPDGDGTRVSWTMTGRNTLMLRVMGIFRSMDKMIGPDFEKGLARLKKTAEGS